MGVEIISNPLSVSALLSGEIDHHTAAAMRAGEICKIAISATDESNKNTVTQTPGNACAGSPSDRSSPRAASNACAKK